MLQCSIKHKRFVVEVWKHKSIFLPISHLRDAQ